MSIAFYMDENVPRQITVGLRLRGVDDLTVQEDGRAGMIDPAVLDRAIEKSPCEPSPRQQNQYNSNNSHTV